MAAPALQKTWQGGSTAGGTQFVNVVVTGTTPRDTLWAMHKAMTGFFANPWTVVGSSDGTTAAMDATDRLVASSNWVYHAPGAARSWLVLQNSAIGANFHALIWIDDTTADPNGENINITCNAGGFGAAKGGADGSTTVLPTPSDTTKNFSIDGTDWIGAEGGSPTQKVITCISSTDGQCFRAVASQQSTGIAITGFGIEVPRFPPTTWTTPAVTYLYKSTVASGLDCFRWEVMADSVTNGEMFANVDNIIGPAGFSTVSMMPQMPMFSTVEVIDLQEDDRPNPMLYPPMLIGADVGAAVPVTERYHGTLFDWYWCNRNVAGKHLLDMDTIPAPQDATPQNAAFFGDDTSGATSSALITDVAQTGLGPIIDLTMSCWVYIVSDNSGGQVTLIDKFTPPGGYRMYLNTNRTTLNFNATPTSFNTWTDVWATGGVNLNEWTHFAVTRNRTTGENKGYKNGVQIGATATRFAGESLLATVEDFSLGGAENINTDLHGYMAEAQLWSVDQSPAWMGSNYNVAHVGNEANLEGYWPLHTDFLDLTANSNDLIPTAGGSVAAPAITPSTRPFAGNIVAPRTFVCVGDPVIGWLDNSVTDLSYT